MAAAELAMMGILERLGPAALGLGGKILLRAIVLVCLVYL